MQITKKLKMVMFEYDFVRKELYINGEPFNDDSYNWVALTRPQMISLTRFILRVLQKGKPRL